MTIRKMPTIPTLPKKKQVAAYARVSSGKDAMLHSLSAQISYYSEYIQKQPEWLYCGVYVDEAVTGTKSERPEFQRLLSDCRAGKIDMIITKSVSRFARNTVTLLETIRELKARGIDVYFEEPNIHTMSAAGEMISFISPVGGVGTSTVAAGFSVYASQCSRKVLYVNLEKNGDSATYFFGSGNANISDVLYDIKSKKSNFGMRLESKASHDDCGVDFLASSPNALDMIYLKSQDIDELIRNIQNTGLYDFLVLDTDCSMDDRMTAVMQDSTNIVVVNNGRETSNRKMERFKMAVHDLEEEAGQAYTPKFCYFLNKFNRTRGDDQGDFGWNLLGGMDEYFGESPSQIIERIVRLDIFDYFLNK